MTDTRTRFLSVLTNHFGAVETAEADILDAVFLRDLKPDSLDVVELLMGIEDEFSITIEDGEAEALSEKITLREILALVEGKVAVKDGEVVHG